MHHLLIGRAGAGSHIGIDDETVSAGHAELVRLPDGRTYLVDRCSTNGTFVFRDGEWMRLRHDFVSPAEPVRFGRVETTLGDLLGGDRHPGDEKNAGAVVWSPDGRLEAKP
ncbi:FHA domain-containing protein [Magnetospirillum sp. SS-4]|uniref:FHA domain-containing protein n=1 Tax=Magnetospirillum sp. SS-4 TaxID=2681465 RepID=UPI00137FA6D8|nr:FHA domain-containing protein [Magnetospirillum sp. SS-4]CAA7617131.1 hypothetical protein MTBSS4_180077 [Magnetospirillum sp. SS-4]